MVKQIYPAELQLKTVNKANDLDTEVPFWSYLSISNCFVSSKIYDKRDNFDFVIVISSIFDGNVLRRGSILFGFIQNL